MNSKEIAELTTQIFIAILPLTPQGSLFRHTKDRKYQEPIGANYIFNSIFDNIASKVKIKKG